MMMMFSSYNMLITAVVIVAVVLLLLLALSFTPKQRARRRRRKPVIPEKIEQPPAKRTDEDIKIQKNKQNEVEKINNLDSPEERIVGFAEAIGPWTRKVLNEKQMALASQRESSEDIPNDKKSRGFWTLFLGLTGGTERGKTYFRDLVKNSHKKGRGGPGM